jgi:hypothetical protein
MKSATHCACRRPVSVIGMVTVSDVFAPALAALCACRTR